MAVYLVKGKAFRVESTGVALKWRSVVNFDVHLQPIPGCHNSFNFFSSVLQSCQNSCKQENNGFSGGLSKKKISVAFIVNRQSDTAHQNPIFGFTKSSLDAFFASEMEKTSTREVKVDLVDGSFVTNFLKRNREPSRIKLEFWFDGQTFNMVSKELSFPHGEGWSYTFENKLVVPWKKSSSDLQILNGTITIELIRCASPLFADATWTIKKILQSKIRCDFALIAQNGKSIPCHSSFLVCHSQVFERMFEADCKEMKEKACQMHLTEATVNALLKFLYYSDLDDPSKNCNISLELLKTAHEYDMASLEIAMKRLILDKSSDWFGWKMVLLLFQFALKVESYQDLKEKAVTVIKSKSGRLRKSPVCDEMFKTDPETAKELFLLVLNK